MARRNARDNGVPHLTLDCGKRFVLAPYQQHLHTAGVWVVHWINLPEPNGWVNIRLYRNEDDKARRAWSLGFTAKGRAAQGEAVRHLSQSHPGIVEWLSKVVKGERPEPPAVSGRELRLKAAERVPPAVRRKAIQIIEKAWQARKPLSMKPQTRWYGRYAPDLIAEKLQADKFEIRSLLEKWVSERKIHHWLLDKTKKIAGLKVSENIDLKSL